MEALIQGLAFLLGGIQVMIQQAIVLQVAKVRHPIIKLFISTVFLMSLYGILSLFLHNYAVLSMSIWVILLIFSYYFIFKGSVTSSVLMGMGQMILSSCIEYIAQLLMMVLQNIIQQNSYFWQIIIRAIIFAVYMCIYFVARKIDIRLLPLNFKKRKRYLWIIYMSYLLLFSVPNLLIIENDQRMLSNSIEIYNVVLFIIFFVYNAIYVHSLGKAADIEQQLEVQRLYSGTLETSLEELRGFKHDFSNIISPIVGYIDSKDWDKLQDISEKIMKKMLKINTTDIVNAQLKESPFLYTMVLSKLHRAESMNIDFHISIQGNIDLKYCDPIDFSRMVGNLLDNAFDSAMVCDKKLVQLEMIKRKDRRYVTIQNSCIGVVDIESIFQNGYTTKQNHTGLGLAQIQSIIEKYRKDDYAMELKTNCDGQRFTQILII